MLHFHLSIESPRVPNSLMIFKYASLIGLASAARLATITVEPNSADQGTVRGTVTFAQQENGLLSYSGSLTGLVASSTHGWHIHSSSIENYACADAGGHYNPTNTSHGSPDAAVGSRHVGDLGNFVADDQGNAVFSGVDSVASFYGDNALTTQAIVIHELIDDFQGTSGNAGGRLACGNIVVEEVKRTATVDVQPNSAPGDGTVKGTITFEQQDGDISYDVSLSGLAPSSTHGWHIHSSGVANFACADAGGHYNPTDATHGRPDAEVGSRHIGDLGNFVADAEGRAVFSGTDKLASFFGEHAITTQAIVIHELEDDFQGASGNAGGRLACGNLVVSKAAVSGDGTPTSGTAEATETTSSASRLEIWLMMAVLVSFL